jgi:hypothetical protein
MQNGDNSKLEQQSETQGEAKDAEHHRLMQTGDNSELEKQGVKLKEA